MNDENYFNTVIYITIYVWMTKAIDYLLGTGSTLLNVMLTQVFKWYCKLDYNGLVILHKRMINQSDKTRKSYIKLKKQENHQFNIFNNFQVKRIPLQRFVLMVKKVVNFSTWHEVHIKYCLVAINVLINMYFSYLQLKDNVGFLYHWISKTDLSFGYVFKLDYGNRIWNSKLMTPNNTKNAQM